MSKDLILEIGTEEIPPQQLPRIAHQLKALAEQELKGQRIDYADLAVYFTPRRLVLKVSEVGEQRYKVETIKGPAKATGFNEDGTPTKAMLGFCRKHNAKVQDLIVKKTQKSEYLFLERIIEGRSTEEVLAELLPKIIKGIKTEQKMRWDDSGLKFIRPIRWLLCLFGERVIEFELGNLKSADETKVHRSFGLEKLRIKDSQDYFAKLRENMVIVDQAERRASMEKALAKVCQELRADPLADKAFLEELANSLEYPTPVVGKIPPEFLKLPREILTMAIIEQQKFIPLIGKDEAFLPHFIGFRDGPEDSTGRVKEGYERALCAKLTDSQYLFAADCKLSLVEHAKALKSIIYQEKLGSIWDKVERIRRFSYEIAKRAGFKNLKEIDRTAFLCKADLVTELVREFPHLRGIAGGIYASLEGEGELVAQGLREHYLPQFKHEPIPKSETGITVSLADKLDTIVGLLLIGQVPTGSRDPFGLRRKATGIMRIALGHKLDIDFFKLIKDLEELFFFLEERKGITVVEEFFRERLRRFLLQEYGLDHDILDCLLAVKEGNFLRVLQKAISLKKVKGSEEFESLIIAFRRLRNITKGHSIASFDPQLFEEEAERELWRSYLKAEGHITKLLPSGDYEGVIKWLSSLKNPLDDYFAQVLVMTKDRELRSNRLGFLLKILNLFFTIGDLSKLSRRAEEPILK